MQRIGIVLKQLVVIYFVLALIPAASAWDQKELITLAKDAIRAEVLGKTPPCINGKSPAKPVFVTIERKGKVIGCRGGLETRSSSLEKEIGLAARSAARHDPRYAPLTAKDLDNFQVTITIVDRLAPINDVTTLTPADGLVLRSGGKIGVVLPWEGKDPEIRLKWAYKKAGIATGTECRLQIMKAERFRG